MDFRTSDFTYDLPQRAIAQPPAARDRSRMLVLHRDDGRVEHRTVRDLPAFLEAGDCVVMNDTKVFKARLAATVGSRTIEVFLVRPDASPADANTAGTSVWLVLAKPARVLREGTALRCGDLQGVVRGRSDNGTVRITFDRPIAGVIAEANRIGAIPTPPYVTERVERLEDYQTTYAVHEGSVAAPTAGFHMTNALLDALRARGVRLATVTLHVGLGTFQPIRSDRLADHVMHAEWVSVPQETVDAIGATTRAGKRVVAIGTTTLRALEGARMAAAPHGNVSDARGLRAFEGFVQCFITPGYAFPVVDALLTNFHLPTSTLLVLVSAFAAPSQPTLRGRDMILGAYNTALAHDYRFYSFGDAMLIT